MFSWMLKNQAWVKDVFKLLTFRFTLIKIFYLLKINDLDLLRKVGSLQPLFLFSSSFVRRRRSDQAENENPSLFSPSDRNRRAHPLVTAVPLRSQPSCLPQKANSRPDLHRRAVQVLAVTCASPLQFAITQICRCNRRPVREAPPRNLCLCWSQAQPPPIPFSSVFCTAARLSNRVCLHLREAVDAYISWSPVAASDRRSILRQRARLPSSRNSQPTYTLICLYDLHC